MPCPCIGPNSSVRSTSRSSVPCSSAARSDGLALVMVVNLPSMTIYHPRKSGRFARVQRLGSGGAAEAEGVAAVPADVLRVAVAPLDEADEVARDGTDRRVRDAAQVLGSAQERVAAAAGVLGHPGALRDHVRPVPEQVA